METNKIQITENDIALMAQYAVISLLNEEFTPVTPDTMVKNDPNEYRPIIIKNILAKHPEFNGSETKAWNYYKQHHMEKREGSVDGKRDRKAERQYKDSFGQHSRAKLAQDAYAQNERGLAQHNDEVYKDVKGYSASVKEALAVDMPFVPNNFSDEYAGTPIAYAEGQVTGEMLNNIMNEAMAKINDYFENDQQEPIVRMEFNVNCDPTKYGSGNWKKIFNSANGNMIANSEGMELLKCFPEQFIEHAIGAVVTLSSANKKHTKLARRSYSYNPHELRNIQTSGNFEYGEYDEEAVANLSIFLAFNEEGKKRWEDGVEGLRNDIAKFYAGATYTGD